jgi:cytoplasmic iron level regulating protein YaaA (DUF328/UPF0246 family)
MKMRPDMHASTPELFEQKLRKITQDEVDKKASSLMKIAKKLGANDEYIKWYATEVAFSINQDTSSSCWSRNYSFFYYYR